LNWREVRKHNRAASARKAKRESHAAQEAARVEREGGPVKVAELRAATRRTVVLSQSRCPVDVWTFRGRDWMMAIGCTQVFRFIEWRYDGFDPRDHLPVTPGAAKWAAGVLEAEEAAEGGSP
jgi:hypothetical protein